MDVSMRLFFIPAYMASCIVFMSFETKNVWKFYYSPHGVVINGTEMVGVREAECDTASKAFYFGLA
jgi:hypothetical protein